MEFIGNGKSIRAVIRKGSVKFVERMSVAGHVFTVLAEDNSKIDQVWVV